MNLNLFRKMFSEFELEGKYPNEVLEIWFGIASGHLPKSRSFSEKSYNYALMLMVAHLISLNEKSASESSGGNSGIVTSASEGSVSVSFSAPPTQNGWEFWLSSTPYGLQLWALLQQMSSGGRYIGGLPERSAERKVGGVYL